jgi:predicted ArsR family transcriptional regulator
MTVESPVAHHVQLCQESIRNVLREHPGISKTALSGLIRPTHGQMWRSVLEGMVKDGEVIEQEKVVAMGRPPLVYTLRADAEAVA